MQRLNEIEILMLKKNVLSQQNQLQHLIENNNKNCTKYTNLMAWWVEFQNEKNNEIAKNVDLFSIVKAYTQRQSGENDLASTSTSPVTYSVPVPKQASKSLSEELLTKLLSNIKRARDELVAKCGIKSDTLSFLFGFNWQCTFIHRT